MLRRTLRITSTIPTIQLTKYNQYDFMVLPGPAVLGLHWPECRSGRQSPVDIDTSLVASTPYLNLRFNRFNQPLFGYSVRAEDRAIRLRAAFKGPGPGITGTALRWVPYQLGAMSWHWGGHRGAGSEHSFNYVQYDGELQLHFLQQKVRLPGGSLFGSREANEPNPRLEQLLEAIQVWARLTNHSSSSSSNLEPFSSLEVPISEPIVLADLFPLPDPVTDQWKVFTYRGSLTTPPCSEVVQYFVLAEVNAIGSEQLSVFRSLRDPATGLSLGNNYRQTQPLNGRQISYF
ncbi:Alpha-carbonic anhydrase [Tyrophagus putrescentiae]|nr:Alpha-carbonic anhydrase [Tyrophagus putrescentiae]